MNKIAVDGQEIAYRAAGSGPPLVLLHGGLVDSRAWRREITASPTSSTSWPGTPGLWRILRQMTLSAPAKMSDAQKAAMAKGRRQARAVRDYLQSLEQATRPGRRLSADELQAKVHEYEGRIADEDDPVARVELIQKRLDFEQRLTEGNDTADPAQFESEFVEVVGEYSDRKGIRYQAWRELGVAASVLRAGGIKRVHRPRT